MTGGETGRPFRSPEVPTSTVLYARLADLLPPEAGHRPLILAVLEGRDPGVVLVDDERSPTAAIICNDNDFGMAIGDAHSAFVARVVPRLADAVAHIRKPSLIASTPAWEAVLGAYLTDRTRRNEYEPPASPPHRPPPAGIDLRDIDRATVLSEVFGQGLDPWVLEVNGGRDAFLERSFGTAAWQDGQLVAFCAAITIAGAPPEAEIEVGTDLGSRGQGIAAAAASRFLGQCQARGLAPAWSCGAGNEASHRLALGLGFRFRRQVATFSLKPAV